MRIIVRVRPSAGRTQVGGRYGDAASDTLVVRVVQATVDGKATAAVQQVLADAFGVRRADVTLISGSKNRTKVFDIDGASDDQLQSLLDR
ncbi:MAG: DUF167 domain-containing protein [Jatrophihabitantaceae bacterium]